jgi:hypothetical protein
MKQVQQNITLPIGNRGYMLSIAQGVGDGSMKGHHVEVALLNGSGEFVNSGRWWFDATYAQIDEGYYDDVVPNIGVDALQWVIAEARAWVEVST